MSQYVDGLVVPVEQTEQAALEGLQGSISAEHVGIELQIRGHILPGQQLDHILSRSGCGTTAAAAGHWRSCRWWMIRCWEY